MVNVGFTNIELAPKNILINHTEMKKFALNFKNKFVSQATEFSEVLEGSSGEDEVEDETFGRIYSRSMTRRGIFPFSSAFSRTRQGIPRNFGLFLSHFKDETFDPCFSRSRTRRGEEFCLIPRPFRGRDETLENL